VAVECGFASTQEHHSVVWTPAKARVARQSVGRPGETRDEFRVEEGAEALEEKVGEIHGVTSTNPSHLDIPRQPRVLQRMLGALGGQGRDAASTP